MDRRQEALPQRLRSHPRGMRGEAEGTDHRDENRARGAEEAKGTGRIHPPGPEGQEGEKE